MTIRQDEAVGRQIRSLLLGGPLGDLTDGQLLERFSTCPHGPGEPAFAELVARHGAMVLRVCRGVLADPHDAEDAFQATFLVLVGKARGLWVKDSLAPWLHQVACRTAKCLRSSAARRSRLERGAAMREHVEPPRDPGDDRERAVLEEVARLPERYRAPLVLCDLEGRTHEQAARHLGWPIGTVKSRQSRGRARLRDRLARRGYAAESGAWVAWMAPGHFPATVPPALADATTRAALGFLTAPTLASGAIAILALEVLRSMTILRFAKAATLLAALASTLAGPVIAQKGGGEAGPAVAPPPGREVPVVPARKERLQSTHAASGAIEAAQPHQVYSDVEGPTALIAIRPEGTVVRAGEAVAELDSATLRDRLINQQISTHRAMDARDDARASREVAEVAVKEYAEATYPQERKALQGAIALSDLAIAKAKARRDRAREAQDRLKGLFPKAPTPTDLVAEMEIADHLDQAELTIAREEAERERTLGRLGVLDDFTKGRVTSDFKIAANRARAEELSRTEAFELERTKGKKLERMIAACKLTAPIDGVVVYANAPPAKGQSPAIEEGAAIRERQKIFSVYEQGGPMRMVATFPESLIGRITQGLEAQVLVDAFPGRTFVGVVESVNPLPDPGVAARSDGRSYTARLRIEGRWPALRPGLTASLKVRLASPTDSITVPKSAVVQREGSYFVSVKSAEGKFLWRRVAPYFGDSRAAVSGVEAGEIVAEDPRPLMQDEAKDETPGVPSPASKPD